MFNSTLPTDNLYKFLALAGVALIMVTFYIVQFRVEMFWQRELDSEHGKLMLAIAIKTKELRDQPKDAKALKEQIMELRSALFDDAAGKMASSRSHI